MRKVFISLLALATLASCTQNEFEEQTTDNEKVEVKLASTVTDIEVGTRAPIEGVSSLEAGVLLSKTTGNYTSPNLLYHGKMTFTDTSTSASFETPQYYPADGSNVYLCGLYPFSITDWTIEATTAAYTFDGKTDVMAAAEKFSTKADGQDGGTSPKLEFKHLLTKVIVKAVVEGDETAVQNAWGEITSIELSEAGGATPNNTVSVNLAAGTALTALDFSAEVGATAPKFYQVTLGTTYTDNLFSAAPIAIPSTATDIAYSMVAPVVVDATAGKYEFKLKITTEKHSIAEDVSIDLKPAAGVTDMQGRECTITLKFKATGVNATASVAPWDTNGGTSDVTIQ